MSENKFTPRAEEVLRLSQEAAEEMGLNLSTAKTRLRRGRARLKDYLQEVGYELAEG